MFEKGEGWREGGRARTGPGPRHRREGLWVDVTPVEVAGQQNRVVLFEVPLAEEEVRGSPWTRHPLVALPGPVPCPPSFLEADERLVDTVYPSAALPTFPAVVPHVPRRETCGGLVVEGPSTVDLSLQGVVGGGVGSPVGALVPWW